MVGTTEGDAGTFMFSGSTTDVMADGDATIGDDDVGKAVGSDEAGLSVNSLTVGGEATGVGTLTLDTGATITTSADATVGDKEGSQGTVTIGLTAGAEMMVGGNLTVGGGGSGTLQVNPGSTLTIQGGAFTIGDESTGNGVVTINGGTLSFGGKLVVGSSGTGILNMQEGATNDLGGISLNTPEVTLGEQTGGNGTLNVDGTGTDFQVGKLTVGESGQGALTVSNAAVLTASGAVSVGDQLSGVISTVTIETVGMFAINNNLTVGGGAVATMDVRTGGQASVIGDTSIGDNPNGVGFLTVEGVAQTGGTPSSFGYGGKLTVGNYGAGTLNITGGAYVAPTPGGVGEVDIAAQNAGTSTGQVTVSGSDSNSQRASELDATNLAVGGTMKAAGATGNLTASDGGMVKVQTTLQTWSKGAVDVSGGGSVTVGTGVVAAAGSVRINVGGTLGGGGTIDGNVVNAGGTVAPGDPMTLTINGDYTQTGGVLELQLGGTGVGEFDSIAATGKISITDATIDLDFVDGFAPTQGETFDLLTSSLGISASNLTFDISGLESGFQFDTTTNSTGNLFVLTADNSGMAAPEPGTLVLLGLGLGAFAWYRRRPAVA
jgi:T5SS/PEP-CTERM-associated repeat protein